MKKKFKIHTLGCRTNKYESQAYFEQLVKLGFEYSEDGANFHIINTCFVTSSAEKTSKEKVKELLAKDEHSNVIITGCCAHLFQDFKSDRVLIVLNKEKEQLVSVLHDHFFKEISGSKEDQKNCLCNKSLSENFPPFKISNFYNQTRAFIKIQDGCNNFCSYCVIPFVRGRSRSRAMSDIFEEVKALAKSGYKEIVLTGINIGDYNFEGNKLSDLVLKLDNIEGLERIRLSSIDPDKVDDKLIDVILNGQKTCSSMHISLQSGSDKILKKMNRNYTALDFLKVVDKLKSKDEDFTFTTDIIVGFPGEDEKDFEESLNIVRQVNFAKVHMFPFSKRKGTLAEKFESQVPKDVTNKRKKILMDLADKTAFELRNKYLGKEMEVLLEQKIFGNRFISGHLDNFLSVKVDLLSLKKKKSWTEKKLGKDCEKQIELSSGKLTQDDIHRNSIIKVKIVQNVKDCLIGEIV